MAQIPARTEKDSMGEMSLPEGAYYGPQTQRAVLNFPISGRRFSRRFIQALGLVKRSAAEVNESLGHLDSRLADAIKQAAQEVMDGKLDDQFVVDIFQTGSGTSTNMNANEVISNRAIEILGGTIGSKDPVHPNDHVNFGQSSNDVIPTAIHISTLTAIHEDLIPAVEGLRTAFEAKAQAYDHIVKSGRTHLMDATPVRLGQEFGAFAVQMSHAVRRLKALDEGLGELAQGGTAVGSGINTDPQFPRLFAAKVAEATGLPFRAAQNHFEANGSRDACVEASGAMKTLATSLIKIANDIRWMGSGPRCGLGELKLPAVQPGSSIMPGKVNPVMAEALMMVSAQVIGHDATVAVSNSLGNFQLNVMMPVISKCLLESSDWLANSIRMFQTRCIDGLEADEAAIAATLERNLAICTALAPEIGYDKAAALSKEAVARNASIREVALADGVLTEAQLDSLLDTRAMTERGIPH